MRERDIYLLSPRALSPETIAVAFAKTSRSPESFRDIAAELSDEQSGASGKSDDGQLATQWTR